MVAKTYQKEKNQKQGKNGIPVSVFNTAVEIPGHALRHNSEIKGMFFRKIIESLFGRA